DLMNILIALLLFFSVFWSSQPKSRTVSADNSVKLIATEAGIENVAPSSRVYKAVLSNQSKDPIRLNAVQMPGGYSGDGRFLLAPCNCGTGKMGNGLLIVSTLFTSHEVLRESCKSRLTLEQR